MWTQNKQSKTFMQDILNAKLQPFFYIFGSFKLFYFFL